ncbi:hypothetical protein ARAM_000569 [Aspergillus rambellii]|uniref:Rhodopsin domain-containing protein n=1 Tax=Aspergillus rambellii TaxID=308745 RepID=A0A0F8UQX4_9EURO|nr:hypothetical protein ARAM_000569 [Aspergillus rambellii]
MRIYAKARLLEKLWWDDMCIIIAWICLLAAQVLIIVGYADELIGVPLWSLTQGTLDNYRKVLVAATWAIYSAGLAFSKFAVLMLYCLLVRKTHDHRRIYIVYITAAFIGASTIALILGLMLSCKPISAGWQGNNPGACLWRTYVYLAMAIKNIIADVMLILIPIPMVRELSLPLTQKVGLMFMFGIGCLTLITSFARLAAIITIVGKMEQSHNLGLAFMFVTIEANFILICATLPYLRQFCRHYCSRWIGACDSRSSDRRTSSNSRKEQRPGPVGHHCDVEIGIQRGSGSHTMEESGQKSEDSIIPHPNETFYPSPASAS